ncbi:hypothetical protein [Hoeflea sp.]|uniref:hypothetical protein n=1 Tax=Hoeflea sp. TaxID=1940281 RepID=UPI003B01DE7F
MKRQIDNLMPYLLLLVSAVLTIWGALGLLEYFIPAIVLGLENEKFPAGLQFLHFFSIFVTGTIFLFGYLTRWRHTPFATIVMYAVLATLCFVETVDFEAFGGGPTRFIPMAIEYVVYVCLSAYLLRSSRIRQHFNPGPQATGATSDAKKSDTRLPARG